MGLYRRTCKRSLIKKLNNRKRQRKLILLCILCVRMIESRGKQYFRCSAIFILRILKINQEFICVENTNSLMF